MHIWQFSDEKKSKSNLIGPTGAALLRPTGFINKLNAAGSSLLYLRVIML
jgi:hypothetical protein